MTDQPKDYEVMEELLNHRDFEELMKYEYNLLPWYAKVLYAMQKHILLTIASSIIVGYLVGKFVF